MCVYTFPIEFMMYICEFAMSHYWNRCVITCFCTLLWCDCWLVTPSKYACRVACWVLAPTLGGLKGRRLGLGSIHPTYCTLRTISWVYRAQTQLTYNTYVGSWPQLLVFSLRNLHRNAPIQERSHSATMPQSMP